MEQVDEVGGGLLMEGFVLDELWDGEPVEILENRGDVINGAGVGVLIEL